MPHRKRNTASLQMYKVVRIITHLAPMRKAFMHRFVNPEEILYIANSVAKGREQRQRGRRAFAASSVVFSSRHPPDEGAETPATLDPAIPLPPGGPLVTAGRIREPVPNRRYRYTPEELAEIMHNVSLESR